MQSPRKSLIREGPSQRLEGGSEEGWQLPAGLPFLCSSGSVLNWEGASRQQTLSESPRPARRRPCLCGDHPPNHPSSTHLTSVIGQLSS